MQYILARPRQRGYSLVEVAIALAVVGIILSGAVFPLGNQLREKTYKRANVQVGEAVDAVVGYAITHRSPGFTYLYTDSLSNSDLRKYGNRLARIPSGRPYLPCPDTDGDGIEDRTSLVIPTLGSDELRFEYDQEETGIIRSERFYYGSIGSNSHDEMIDVAIYEYLGTCLDYAGALPWRTLGLPSSDPWGSRLTYAVNPMFATAAFGFDQQTRAASHLNIMESDFVSADNLAHNRPHKILESNRFNNFFYNPIIPCPISTTNVDAICLQGLLETTDATYPSSLGTGSLNHFNMIAGTSDLAPAYVGQHTPYVPADYYTVDGGTGANDPYRTATDGLPFVIISHGANRKGAKTDNRDNATACADPPVLANEPFEYYNALLSNCIDVEDDDIDRAEKFRQVSVFAFSRGGLKASNPVETTEYSYGADSAYVFDDVVGWLTRRELRVLMKDRGVFPLPETFDGLLSGKATYVF